MTLAICEDVKLKELIVEKSDEWVKSAEKLNKHLRGKSAIGGKSYVQFYADTSPKRLYLYINSYNQVEDEKQKQAVFSCITDLFDVTEDDIVSEGKIKVGFFKSWLDLRAKEL